MKVQKRPHEEQKLCHYNIGDVVQLIDENLRLQPEFYMIAVRWFKGEGNNWTAGLYNVNGEILLVDIETGEAKDVNLSKRAIRHKNAKVVF